MAEYWKSAPRHWCKQCKVFIRDTPFEKTQHEASGKHQSSLRRFLRDIHKNNENQQKETQRAKSEVERLRKAVGGGSSASSASSDPAPKRAAAPAPKPVSVDERKKQIAQLAEMGVAVPEEYRGDMALAGDWQTLSETKVDTEGLEGAAKSIGVRKRKHDGDEEDEHIPEPVARLGSQKTKQSAPSIAKQEPEEQKQEPASVVKTEDEAPDSKSAGADESLQIKTEVPIEGSALLADEEPPAEDETGPIFKKRKPKVMRK
ncbi:Zinc finger U1-type [Penicillium atrosanguineum]|uniref:Zinc finger U1-type n=1 Tax=Penicillium atrosanguineum TaxID=1132637 RepID=A0A9W9U897_9EURO|nr:Zinc finger U1-type [Penicillium atrosanguineum]